MKRDFDRYYNQVYLQYKELQDNLKELSKELDKGMVTPEQVQQLKSTLSPVVTNYQTLSYIKYLLDLPAKKSKKNRFKKQSNLLNISKDCNGDNLLKQNKLILENSINKWRN